ncbi:NTF2-like protein [Auriscalpium vulgare]|uniref:NTF2-like protein n=1 Tax=Auriscalpium vulgare TaxID=40419 RepID=A0ACB8R7N3_9AGAM|nr:NTF2-like protein [Auriscalpium vulgare]
MFQTPPPAASGSRTLASNALRKAGLIDRDERMRDASEKQGGRKGSSKLRSHQSRLAPILGKPLPSLAARKSTLATRIGGAPEPSVTIRGAAKTPATRGRRNAISMNGGRLPGSRTLPGSVLEVWKQFVNQRWDPAARFLNLERIADDEFIKKSRVAPPGGPSSTGREAAVIFKLAAQLKPAVQSLSLAHNRFNSTQPISMLPHYLPDLENLSLANNEIRVWKDIDYLSQLSPRQDKLRKLREIILVGNPIRENEYQHNRVDSYKNNIIRRFPTLEMLDGEAVPKIAFDAPQSSQAPSTSSGPRPAATSFPAEMCPSFIVGVDPGVTSAFLSRFFSLYDTNRQALLDVYNESATFSFQANTSIPARARIQGFQHTLPNQKNLEWQGWLRAGSRNLSRVGGAMDKILQSLHVGREEVVKTMSSFPAMRHDPSGSPEKFLVDAWPITQENLTMLFVSVHGQFTEELSGGIRSFDRTFVLVPAPEGSRAQAAGWGVEILSDQLVIRAYSSHEAWTPGPLLVQAPAAAPGLVPMPSAAFAPLPALSQPMQELLATIPELQKTQVMQVCQRTRLNVKFAIDCLQGNGWNIDAAVANFEQVKGTLPRDAFM